MRLAFLFFIILGNSFYAFAQNDSIESASRVNKLHEVVVKATKPLTKFDGDGVITTITGTPLQSLGSASDVLGYLPGLINNNGAIEVIGKGRPVIFVNKQKITTGSALTQIPAAKIKDVKVIHNPGARYDGSTNAVIIISTVREIGDGLSLDTRTTIGVRNYVYGKELLNMNYRNGGLDIFTALEYDYNRSKGSGKMRQNLWGRDLHTSDMDMNARKRSRLYDGKIGFNYITPAGHYLGAFYQNTYKPGTSDITSYSASSLNGNINNRYDVSSHDRDNHYEHFVDGYYSGNWGKWTADLTFDIFWKNAKTRQQIQETIIGFGTNNMNLSDNSHGRMFAGKLNLARPLWRGSVDIGTEYTNSCRNDDFTSNSSAISSNDNKIKETNLGVYAQLMQKFGRVMLQVGLRYENINSRYFEFGKEMPEQSKTYNEFLPSAAIVLPVKNSAFQLSYSRKYTRPLYSQLSSTVYYLNQNNYETGNPNLKNTFIDNVSLNFKYRWLMVMASYKHIKGRIITACTEYEGNPDVTLYRKENSDRSINNAELMVSAMPGLIKKFYYPVVMAGVVAQFYDIDYRGGTLSMNKPMALIRFNNIFRLPHNYMIYANFSYRSDFDSENVHMYKSWQFDISASKTFNKHWDIRLSITDVFNSARKSGFTIYSGMRNVENIRFNTMRGAEVTIGYKFNTTKSKYKGNGAGHSEKERL